MSFAGQTHSSRCGKALATSAWGPEFGFPEPGAYIKSKYDRRVACYPTPGKAERSGCPGSLIKHTTDPVSKNKMDYSLGMTPEIDLWATHAHTHKRKQSYTCNTSPLVTSQIWLRTSVLKGDRLLFKSWLWSCPGNWTTLSFRPVVYKMCLTLVQWTKYLCYFEMYVSGLEPLRQWC